MLAPNLPLTLVTVTHSATDLVHTERMPRMLAAFTPPSAISRHVVVMSEETWKGAQWVRNAFEVLPWPVLFVDPERNCWDMPGYNLAAPYVETPWWIGISCDTRICRSNWLDSFCQHAIPNVGIAGARGPAVNITPAVAREEKDPYAWVGQLLLVRNLDFDTCEHVQTWCFLMQTEAFNQVKGCWVPPDNEIHGKGDLIAAEVYLSVAMRKAGYLSKGISMPLHHYGTGSNPSEADLDAFDRSCGFSPF